MTIPTAPTEENDNFNEDEILVYLVCLDCGEAFEGTATGIMFAQAHEPNCAGLCSYEIRTEKEAM
jgi:hypothetical protein